MAVVGEEFSCRICHGHLWRRASACDLQPFVRELQSVVFRGFVNAFYHWRLYDRNVFVESQRWQLNARLTVLVVKTERVSMRDKSAVRRGRLFEGGEWS